MVVTATLCVLCCNAVQNVTSVQWLPPRSGTECLIVAGVADGSLFVYKVRAVG